MDDGRLGIVRRQENSHRKFICILNDVIKSRWTTVDDWLSREKFHAGVKLDKKSVQWRKKSVQQRVLQQCLKMRKEALSKSSAARKFGCYGGKPLYSYSRDIERYISDMHPKKRRERRVKKELSESIQRGRIIDPVLIPGKVDTYFKKNWQDNDEDLAEKRRLKREKELEEQEGKKMFARKTTLPPIRGIVNNFHRFTLDDDDDESNEKPKNEKEKVKNDEVTKIKKDTSNESGVPKSSVEKTSLGPRTDTKGLLKLSPVQTTKALVKENSNILRAPV